jgi:hypothetical protein
MNKGRLVTSVGIFVSLLLIFAPQSLYAVALGLSDGV